MIQRIKELYGYIVRAKDGDIGSVEDFYFDDQDWSVRYLILDTGEWLDGRKVLLSPVALSSLDNTSQQIPTQLTREMVMNSPEIDVAKPVLRRKEIELHNYYQWPYYWGSTSVSGIAPGNLLASYPLIELREEMEEQAASPEEEDASNLRSTREVFGYRLHARDGEIGQVKDFIIEDEAWNILYMVVDTGGWLSGRKVLVSPNWVEQVSWLEKRVHIDLNRDTIQNSPEYDPSVPLDKTYESRLYQHYGREK